MQPAWSEETFFETFNLKTFAIHAHNHGTLEICRFHLFNHFMHLRSDILDRNRQHVRILKIETAKPQRGDEIGSSTTSTSNHEDAFSLKFLNAVLSLFIFEICRILVFRLVWGVAMHESIHGHSGTILLHKRSVKILHNENAVLRWFWTTIHHVFCCEVTLSWHWENAILHICLCSVKSPFLKSVCCPQ